MSGPGKISDAIVGTILCLAILMAPSQLFAVSYIIEDDDDGREEWHGPGDPEGGDRYLGDMISIEPYSPQRGATDVSDPRDPCEAVPQIELIPFGDGYMLIIRSWVSSRAYPILLSR